MTAKRTSITIIDKEYLSWVKDLALRYRQSQIKAAVKVNSELLKYYYVVGRDIVTMCAEKKWGDKFLQHLSEDLKRELPDCSCFSPTNLLYMKNFYLLYSRAVEFTPQVGEQLPTPIEFLQQSFGIFQVPWGHHKLIIDKFKDDIDKALFFVRKIVENSWSRSMLVNWIDTGLYEREGKALSNFNATLPAPMSDLANEITKDPYNFAFVGITQKYNETQLKSALLRNITNFLLELGAGFAYVGKEYRLQVGDTEKFIDLLFYHLQLRCYVVIEVKTEKFDFRDMGQIGGYVVACNHLLKRPEDNPTIGLLICKDKNNLLAQYSLESTNQPIAISQYDLERLYPTKVDGLIPTIEEIEAHLSEK